MLVVTYNPRSGDQNLASDGNGSDPIVAVRQTGDGLAERRLFEADLVGQLVHLIIGGQHVLGPTAVPVDADRVVDAALLAVVRVARVTKAADVAAAVGVDGNAVALFKRGDCRADFDYRAGELVSQGEGRRFVAGEFPLGQTCNFFVAVNFSLTCIM